MGKQAGTLSKFKCVNCGSIDLVTGGSSDYHCAECRSIKNLKNLDDQKYLAHQAVAKARKNGFLEDPSLFSCTDCSKPAIEYDHRDYSKPLDVVPVCRKCNLLRGAAIGYGRNSPDVLTDRVADRVYAALARQQAMSAKPELAEKAPV